MTCDNGEETFWYEREGQYACPQVKKGIPQNGKKFWLFFIRLFWEAWGMDSEKTFIDKILDKIFEDDEKKKW